MNPSKLIYGIRTVKPNWDLKNKATGAAVLLVSVLFLSMGTRAQFRKNITLEGYLPYDTCLSALWGYTDESGREYAIVGTCKGTSVVDLNEPGNPKEVYFVPGPKSIWREVKTYKHYAYVVTEGGGGLTVINLKNLPDTNLSYTKVKLVGADTLRNGHTIWIDEKGKCFIYGATGYPGGGGCVILNLEPDPANPTYFANIGWPYFHDGFVRNDTLYAAAIYEGYFGLFQINDSTDIVFRAAQTTPGVFTHNAWPDDESKVLFVTDEVADGYVTAYDIADWGNIREISRIQMDPPGGETPHNVRYLNGWLPTAYYREGVVLIDAHRPENMVITGYYDTFWPDTGSNFWGVWDAYPFFPSGRIIAGDRQNGLFVLNPDYVRAGYLEGTVTDTATGNPLNGVDVFFSGLMPGQTLSTDILGTYKTGSPDSGLFLVSFVKAGYESKTRYVTLRPGEVTQLDVQLRPLGYVPPPPAGDFSDLAVWPVPADDRLEILGIPFSVDEVKLTDMNGKTIFTQKVNEHPYLVLDTRFWAQGVYGLHFVAGKELHTVKVTVVHP
jgi:choice-of-anchor B domain-containing protein